VASESVVSQDRLVASTATVYRTISEATVRPSGPKPLPQHQERRKSTYTTHTTA